MTEAIFFLPIAALQPSQLYISASKLAAVQEQLNLAQLDPLPVKSLAGAIILTDGHTRALAAHLAGAAELKVYWDQDDLDWEAYEICVAWCRSAGIQTVAALADRVLAHEQYEHLWYDRCREMQADLEARRLAQAAEESK